jgi:hypothetical protein
MVQSTLPLLLPSALLLLLQLVVMRRQRLLH